MHVCGWNRYASTERIEQDGWERVLGVPGALVLSLRRQRACSRCCQCKELLYTTSAFN